MCKMGFWMGLFVLITLSAGCQKAGTEAAPCYPNNTCNGNLKCYSKVCVDVKKPGKTKGTARAMADYKKNVLRKEAVEMLGKIRDGARMYYVTDHWDSNGNLLPKGFPSNIRTTPRKPHCKKKLTTTATWDTEGWGPIHFTITEPHYCAYAFVSSGSTGVSATYSARAYGDLDCDGVLSTFELRGSIDAEGSVKIVGPIISNELE